MNNIAVERILKEKTECALEFQQHSYIHLRMQNCNVNLYFYVHSLLMFSPVSLLLFPNNLFSVFLFPFLASL